MSPKRLAHYELQDKIGEGGMGEVYRARDTKLDREVAIKLLPDSFAQDAERLQRFEQEARATGSLNHPNLVTVHDFGVEDGKPYLVMELIEGETLREAMGHGVALPSGESGAPGSGTGSSLVGSHIPTRKALELATQIAEGLAAAHEKGIAHRDLKPENILVTRKGQAKILDFGLAKLVVDTPEDGATMATQAATRAPETEAGRILGTVGYMSPEQVRGEPIDYRTDIFSLGVILYEMLSGQRAFARDSGVETMTAILREDPASLTSLSPTVSPVLDRVVRRCLEKRPGERFQSAQDLAFAIAAAGEASSGAVEALADVPSGRGGAGRWIGMIVGALALAVVGFLVGRSGSGGGGADTASGGTWTLSPFSLDRTHEIQPAISPDGKSVVFVRRSPQRRLFYQRVGSDNAIPLSGSVEAEDWGPRFSPDGQKVAFNSTRDGGGIFVMDATGGGLRRVTDFGFDPDWSPDGTRLVFSTSEVDTDPQGRATLARLWTVDVASGETTQLPVTHDGVQPRWSPRGDRIAAWGLPLGTGQRLVFTVGLTDTAVVPVVDDEFLNWNPVWSADGSTLYYGSDRGGRLNVWRVAIDPVNGQTQGSAEQVTVSTERMGAFDVASTGRMVVTSNRLRRTIGRVAFDTNAMSMGGAIDTLLSSNRWVDWCNVSPNGEWMVYTIWFPQEDLIVSAIGRDDVRRLTRDREKDRTPLWSPDSERVWFYSDRDGGYNMWSIRRDGSDLRKELDLPMGQGVLSVGEDSLLITDIIGLRNAVIAMEDRHDTDSVPWFPSDMGMVGMSLSPDRNRLIGVIESVRSGRLGVLDRRTGRVTEFADRAEMVDGRWLADGQTYAYSTAGRLDWVRFREGTTEIEARGTVTSPAGLPAFTEAQVTWDLQHAVVGWTEEDFDLWVVEQESVEGATP